MADTDRKLNPTLWRTCRVLANSQRLLILRELFEKPGQNVSDLAKKTGLTEATASQYLRGLNARGLLAVYREGRNVFYTPAGDDTVPGATRLVRELRRTFSGNKKAAEHTYRNATAFTHPRRLRIVRELQGGGLSVENLRSRTGISRLALARHLAKLTDRGFLHSRRGVYRLRRPKTGIGRLLLDLALDR